MNHHWLINVRCRECQELEPEMAKSPIPVLMYAVFVFFLVRPKASAYFTHSDNVPNQKPAK